MSLKPESERKLSADQVIARLRPKLGQVAGARLFLQASQDIRVGGRQSNAQYQYTLQADSVSQIYDVGAAAHRGAAERTADHRSQLRPAAERTRDRAGRRPRHRFASGAEPGAIDNTLYDAFGQRQVSTIYVALNQYHVVMEVAPQYWQSPDTLKSLCVSTAGGTVSGRSRPTRSRAP